MPKRFSNGGNGKSNQDIASNQSLNTAAGLSNYYNHLLLDIRNVDDLVKFSETIYELKHADIIVKNLIKQDKYTNFFEVFKNSVKKNGIIFTPKLLNIYTKKLKSQEKYCFYKPPFQPL